jgi:hypothetical protein
MYRLINYLGGTGLTRFSPYKSYALEDFTRADKSARDKLLSDSKNVDTIVRIINLYNVNDKHMLKPLLKALAIITESYSDVANKINWIPIYINDKIVTYANRKTTDLSVLEKQLLSKGWIENLNMFVRENAHLIVKSINPDSIKLEYVYEEPKVLYLGIPPSSIESLIDFIFFLICYH